MDPQILQSSGVWALARRQYGVVARWQLLELGFRPDAIKHRISKGRLHPVGRGVYAVGAPHPTRYGRWMAAVLICGPGAALSHDSAAALLEIRADRGGAIEVSVPAQVARRPRGLVVHRRGRRGPWELAAHHGIPVTSPVCTLVDLATRLNRAQLEAAINEANKRDLTDPESLRWRPMDCATTAPRHSRRGTGCATRRTSPRARRPCASPTARSASSPSTWSRRWIR
jgi:transcriptional regulator with AbiEi antitoxin domain of type IV toxin-antitoxin system